MNRRHFLSTMGGLPLIGSLNGVAWAATEPTANVALATPYNKLLILIELKGANDGLNTVIPFANPLYAESLHDGQFLVLPNWHQRLHGGMQPRLRVQLQNLVAGDCQPGP